MLIELKKLTAPVLRNIQNIFVVNRFKFIKYLIDTKNYSFPLNRMCNILSIIFIVPNVYINFPCITSIRCNAKIFLFTVIINNNGY